MYTFWGEGGEGGAHSWQVRVRNNVHILWQGGGLKAMYTFWGVEGCTFLAGGGSKAIYTFIGRGRVKSNVHIQWLGEG